MLDRLETTLRIRGGARLRVRSRRTARRTPRCRSWPRRLLAKGTVTLHRVPRITDVSVMWSLLEALGARIRYEGDNTVTIDASNVASYRAPYALVRKLAASFDVVGAAARAFRPRRSSAARRLRARHARDRHARTSLRRARMRRPQRARLSDRRSRKRARLRGATIEFRMPSVGATKNAMLAAVLADGTTTMKNVAMEPEVVDLADFLGRDGREDRRARHRHDRHRRRRRTARRRVRDHPRSHRHRNAAARRRRDARRRDRHGLPSRTSAAR